MAGGYPITDPEGKEWKSSEALFQAMRFSDDGIREEIRAAKNGFAAKIVAKKHPDKMTVEPLSDADLENMMDVLHFKIDQHPNLQAELLATGDQLIVEDVTARGLGGRNGFWGAALKNGTWEGQNILGKMWMEIRMGLRHAELVDKKYSTGLTDTESAEFERIELQYEKADEKAYGPVIERLETVLRKHQPVELTADDEARIKKEIDDLTSDGLLDGDY